MGLKVPLKISILLLLQVESLFQDRIHSESQNKEKRYVQFERGGREVL